MEWGDVYKLAHWVLRKQFKITDTDEYISEAYICFDKCKQKYKPEFSTFASYYRTCLVGHMMDYFTYHNSLIHVPKRKKESHSVSVSSMSEPISDSDGSTTLGDMLEGHYEAEDAEEQEQAMWLSRIDNLWPKLTNAERKAVPFFKEYILNDAIIPKEHRTPVWRIRQKLLDYVDK